MLKLDFLKKITVAIVSHREKEALALTLKDIKNQNALDRIKEVLIFLNSACSQTTKVAESFLNQLPLKIFSSSINNLGSARSVLVDRAQSDLLAFTDSDCRLPKNWLETLILNYEKASSSVVAVGGPNRLPSKRLWQKVLNLSLSHPFGHGYSPQAEQVRGAKKVFHIPTTNGLFLKQAVLNCGNFSAKYKSLGEDLDLGLRLTQKGDMILFPYPLVINNYACSYLAVLKRLFAFGAVRAPIHLNYGSDGSKVLYYIRLCFSPFMISFFILGIFEKVFFLGLLIYLGILFGAALELFIRSKKALSGWVPVFWTSQHFFYSAGAFYGRFIKKRI